MLYIVEEQSEEPTITEEAVVTEDGEVLRLQRRNGKPVAVRTRPGVRGSPPARTPELEAECHACGNKGTR